MDSTIGKYVEKYGLQHFGQSMWAIEETTKRNTDEYAIRPFIRRYPDKTLEKMPEWARPGNYHLQRLASEGLRPKLPWATKLEIFIQEPKPVFAILDILKEDEVMIEEVCRQPFDRLAESEYRTYCRVIETL